MFAQIVSCWGGGGPMECGEMGCNQHREPEAPKIDASKALSKHSKIPKNNIKLFYKILKSSHFVGGPMECGKVCMRCSMRIFDVPYVRKVKKCGNVHWFMRKYHTRCGNVIFRHKYGHHRYKQTSLEVVCWNFEEPEVLMSLTRMCLLRLDDWLKLLAHTWHLWGRCFSWTCRMWMRRRSRFSKDLKSKKQKTLDPEI